MTNVTSVKSHVTGTTVHQVYLDNGSDGSAKTYATETGAVELRASYEERVSGTRMTVEDAKIVHDLLGQAIAEAEQVRAANGDESPGEFFDRLIEQDNAADGGT